MDNVPEAKRFKKDKVESNKEQGQETPLIRSVTTVNEQVEFLGENPDLVKNAEVEETVQVPEAPSTSVPSNYLVEDVLIQILSNTLLDTQDLLNCRLVDRTWWNVATSTLLKRDMCRISLKIIVVPVPSSCLLAKEPTITTYCHERNHNLFLDNLTQLISTSRNFPCTSFRFLNCKLDSVQLCFLECDPNSSSVKDFFEICGAHIKTLCAGDLIMRQFLIKLLVHTCNLEFLDFILEEHVYRNVTSDYGRYDRRRLIKDLLKVYSQIAGTICQCIEVKKLLPRLVKLRFDQHAEVIFDTQKTLLEFLKSTADPTELQYPNKFRNTFLKLLIQMKKTDLVKALKFIPVENEDDDEYNNGHVNSEFKNLAETKPMLSKLEVNFDKLYYVEQGVKPMEKILNEMLDSSKDSLEELHFHVYEFKRIKFPRFTQLKYLNLTENCSQSVSQTTRKQLQIVEDEEGDPQDDDPEEDFPLRIFQFHKNRFYESFPVVENVHLDITNYGHDGSLMLFFHQVGHFYRAEDDDDKRTKSMKFDELEGVRNLEIYSEWPSIYETHNFHRIFPCIKSLKLKCASPTNLSNSLWVMSPTVESIEIYGIQVYRRPWEKMIDFGIYVSEDNMDDFAVSHLVDSFFTGFSDDLCQKLQNLGRFPRATEVDSKSINFIRAKPWIGYSKCLKELKFFCVAMHDEFASQVSVKYAFKHMPQTKITFVHTGPIELNETKCEMREFLKPILSCVTLTHQKMPERFAA